MDEYLDDLVSYGHRDKHTDQQYKYLAENMDLIGRFEDINDHWTYLRSMFTWLPELLHLNKTTPSTIPPLVAKKLSKIYEKDYRLWHSLGPIK